MRAALLPHAAPQHCLHTTSPPQVTAGAPCPRESRVYAPSQHAVRQGAADQKDVYADEEAQDEQAEPHGCVEQQGQKQEPIGRKPVGPKSSTDSLSTAGTHMGWSDPQLPAQALPRDCPASPTLRDLPAPLNEILSPSRASPRAARAQPEPSPVAPWDTPTFPTDVPRDTPSPSGSLGPPARDPPASCAGLLRDTPPPAPGARGPPPWNPKRTTRVPQAATALTGTSRRAARGPGPQEAPSPPHPVPQGRPTPAAIFPRGRPPGPRGAAWEVRRLPGVHRAASPLAASPVRPATRGGRLAEPVLPPQTLPALPHRRPTLRLPGAARSGTTAPSAPRGGRPLPAGLRLPACPAAGLHLPAGLAGRDFISQRVPRAGAAAAWRRWRGG